MSENLIKENPKEKIQELNILRAFAFFFVILQHALGSAPGDYSMSVANVEITNILISIADAGVPFFLFLSGLTTAYNYKDKLDIKKYYKNKFLYLIIPYIIFTFVNIMLFDYSKLKDFFMVLIAGDGNFHLWYMGMFIRLVLIYPIFIYIGRFIHKQNIFVRIVTFVLLVRGFLYMAAYESQIKSFFKGLIFGETPTFLQSKFVDITFLFWSIFVIIGMYVGFNFKVLKKYIVKLRFVLYILFILGFYYKFSRQFYLVEFTRIFDIGARLSNIGLFYLISLYILRLPKLSKVMEFSSKYSYVGYMLHIWVLNYYIFFLRGLGFDHPLYNAIVSALITFIVAPLLVFVISLLPKSSYITGTPSNYNLLRRSFALFKQSISNIYSIWKLTKA
ncbi:acyltransferase [Clostridium chrysemydis]|uniref:acyltransferase n=1 Tax=Clostridium chrysemydis TaxID=2665504 RepID=UPI003F3CF047